MREKLCAKILRTELGGSKGKLHRIDAGFSNRFCQFIVRMDSSILVVSILRARWLNAIDNYVCGSRCVLQRNPSRSRRCGSNKLRPKIIIANDQVRSTARAGDKSLTRHTLIAKTDRMR